MAVRYALLAAHPRKQLNFTLDSLHAAESAIKALKKFSASLAAAAGASDSAPSGVFDAVLAALRDDLNTPAAFGALFTAINTFELARATPGDRAAFEKVVYALGFRLAEDAGSPSLPAAVDALAKKRWDAKKARDFAAADRLRGELATAGWSMLDGKDGYRLEPLKKA
jgi:cysteinyl-tRNA synthetase